MVLSYSGVATCRSGLLAVWAGSMQPTRPAMCLQPVDPCGQDLRVINELRLADGPDNPLRPDTPDAIALEQNELDQRDRRVKALAICVHMSLNVGAMLTVLASRPILLRAFLTRPSQVARTLAYVTSMVGVTEFVLNPLAGHLSDIIGRKAFLLQSPIVSIVMKLLVYFRPSVATIVAERVLCGACTTIGGSTTSQTVLADLIDDPTELGQAFSLLGTAAGVGVMLGPIVGAAVSDETTAKNAYVAGAAISGVQFIWTQTMVDETLELAPVPGKAPTVDLDFGTLLAKVNPFAFLKLFRGSSKLATLVSIAALQCTCEGKAISDLKSYYFLSDVPGFTLATRALYQTFWGITMAFSGVCGKETIKRLGMHGHTTLQNVFTCLAFSAVASASSVSTVFATLPLYFFAMERRAAISSWAVKEAVASGMGKGEFSAAFFNLRALAVAIAPLLYVKAYSSGIRAVPRATWRPWLLAITFCAMAEGLHQSMQFRGMGLRDKRD